MDNKQNIPSYKLKGLNIAQKFLPSLAYKMALELFYTPFSFPTTEEEFDYKRDLPIYRELVDEKRITIYLGGAPPFKVLLVHGWSGRASQFLHIGEGLKKAGIPYISFTAPAHGTSNDKRTHMLEFATCIEQISRLYGPFDCIVGHSLGGTALMNSLNLGVEVEKVVLIGSHATTTGSIKDFVKKFSLNSKVEEYLFKHLEVNYHKDYEKYGVVRLAKEFDGSALIIHDEEDKECNISNAENISAAFKNAELFKTSGFGHTRILANKDVVNKIVEFVKPK